MTNEEASWMMHSLHPLDRCAASRRTQTASLGILERQRGVEFDPRAGGRPTPAGERRFGAECRVGGSLFVFFRGGVGVSLRFGERGAKSATLVARRSAWRLHEAMFLLERCALSGLVRLLHERGEEPRRERGTPG